MHNFTVAGILKHMSVCLQTKKYEKIQTWPDHHHLFFTQLTDHDV